MNISESLSSATIALQQAVTAIGGEEAALEACDRMYRATFRSEPYPLKELSDWEDEVDELYLGFALPIYLSATKQSLPIKPDGDASDYEFDSYYSEMESLDELAKNYMEKHFPDFAISGDLLIVDLCNYKGEGEGFDLFEKCQSYPVFTSKKDSFHQING